MVDRIKTEFDIANKSVKQLYKGFGLQWKTIKASNTEKTYEYFYGWKYDPETRNNKWVYIGKKKPQTVEELKRIFSEKGIPIPDIPSVSIPDPPVNVLQDINYEILGNDVLIGEKYYEKIETHFIECRKFKVTEMQ